MKRMVSLLTKMYSSIWSLFLRCITVVSSFLFSWVLARALGAEGSGEIFFLITLATIFSVVAARGQDLGIAKFVARIPADEKGKIESVYLYSLRKSCSSILFCCAIFGGYVFWTFKPLSYAIVIFLSFSVISISFLYMHITSYLFQGIGNIHMMVLSQRTIFNFISFVFFSILVLYLYYCKGLAVFTKSSGFQYIVLMISSIVAAIIIILYQKMTKKNNYDSNCDIVVSDLPIYNKSCAELYRVQLYQLITMYFSLFVINFFATKSDIAGFVVSQRVSTILGFFVLAVSGVVSSLISKSFSDNDIKKVQKYAFQSVVFSMVLGGPLSVVLILFPDVILGFFGADFKEFSLVLVILTVSQLINCLTGACDMTLMFIDGETEHKRNVSVGTLFALILSAFLIPIYGAVGAAISASISAIVVNVLDVIDIKRKVGFWIFLPD